MATTNSTAPRCTRVTVRDAKRELKELGMTLKTTDGEHRVTFKAMSAEAAEKVAYYTNDLDDAVATAIDMAKRQRDRMRSMPV